jgi:hypothetical protein
MAGTKSLSPVKSEMFSTSFFIDNVAISIQIIESMRFCRKICPPHAQVSTRAIFPCLRVNRGMVEIEVKNFCLLEKLNLSCGVALHFYHYNFMRIHQSLRVTPAMQANVTHRLWLGRFINEHTDEESGLNLT